MSKILFHLAFPVTDLDAAKKFYVDGLGCTLGRETDNAVILGLAGRSGTSRGRILAICHDSCYSFPVVDRGEMNVSRTPSQAVSIKSSARKLAARSQLKRLALKMSDGHDYRLEEALLPGITSAQAREALKAVPGSLAQTVVDERQHG